MKNDDLRVIAAFHRVATEKRLDYLVIGGFAASFWGTPRFTADVDYVIPLTSFELAKEVTAELGYVLSFTHPKLAFAHFSPADAGNFRIDFMLVAEDTWEKLFSSKGTMNLGSDALYPVVSAEHLVAMKLHAAKQSDRTESDKDLGDVVEIMCAQGMSFELLENNGILDKYGNEEILTRLRDLLARRDGS